VRRLELEREPVGDTIPNEDELFGAPEPAAEILTESESQVDGLILSIVIEGVREERETSSSPRRMKVPNCEAGIPVPRSLR